MESLKNPSIPEMLFFLKKKYSIQEKDLIFMQEKFKIEMENVMKIFEEERKRIDGRYMKIIADHIEVFKEKNQVLYKRIDELKMEKSEVEDRLGIYHEKLIESNGRVSDLKEEMRKINEVKLNSAENGKSTNEAPLINLTSERGDPTRNPSACQAIVCFKDNLSVVSNKKEHLHVIVISKSDDDVDTNDLASSSNLNSTKRKKKVHMQDSSNSTKNKKKVHVQDSSNATKKRKRSMNEGKNRDASSSKTAHVLCPRQNSVFIRRSEDDKVELPLRISDKPYWSGNDNDSCNTRKLAMLIKEGRKCLSENDLCTSFENDPKLCLNAVCALYRQQISENKSSYIMSQIDEMSITALGNYLIAGDPENKLTMSEVSLEEQAKCRRLAIRYCHQLFKIYHSKKDRLFCHGAGIL